MDVPAPRAYMVLKFIFFFICLISLTEPINAGVFRKYFKKKDFKKILETYYKNPRSRFSKEDFIIISLALRKAGQYRDDIKLNTKFVKAFFLKEHNRLLRDTLESNTIDPDEYKDAQKLIYWIILDDYLNIISNAKKRSELKDNDLKQIQTISKLLEGLEFREGRVDKINTKINNHIQYLEEKIFRFESSFFMNFITWQRDLSLFNSINKKTLLVTNSGYCLGGDLGVSNYRYHFFMDGCFLIGSGGVTNITPPPTYQQSNVPVMGIKAGPGASIIVSDSRSRIGIKIPVIVNVQRFQNPPSVSGYQVEELNPTAFTATLYSRFNFGKWYFATEFGKYFAEERSTWSLGIGKEF